MSDVPGRAPEDGGSSVTGTTDREATVGGRLVPYAFSFLSQGLSSATNLGLSILAGRILGPEGLGTVFIGFTAYVLAVGIQRVVVGEALVSVSADWDGADRSASAEAALTLVLLGGAVLAGGFLVAGLLLGGDAGRGLVLFSPWIVLLQVQDFWRILHFRDREGHKAALNDAVWFLVMAAGIPVAFAMRVDWAVAGVWALGGAAGGLLGFRLAGIRPMPLGTALARWRTMIWPVGRWLVAETLVYYGAFLALVLALDRIVGSAELGGYRSVQTLFAPLSFLLPAIGLPGLPSLTRAWARSVRAARRLAVRLSAAQCGLTLLYLGIVSIPGAALLSMVFGRGFSRFGNLILPVGLTQVVVAAASGFILLLKAQRRTSRLLGTRALLGAGSVAVASAAAAVSGLQAAVWALAGMTVLGSIMVGVAALTVRPEEGNP